MQKRHRIKGAVLATALLALAGSAVTVGMAPNLPPFDKVTEGLTRVMTTNDGSLYDLYKDDETGKLLAVLPANYDRQEIMIACTVSGGDPQAGVMGPTIYGKWEKINGQLVLIEPNFQVRTGGDAEARNSTEQLFTGRVIMSVPIVSMQGNRPVIDLGGIAVGKAGQIFGSSIFGSFGAAVRGLDPRLARLTKAKAFPDNIVIEYEAPAPNGRLTRVAYSISKLEGTPGFKPRAADSRVGYFYNWHQDFAQSATAELTERYITRWHLEKRDPSLKLSPPKEPIVWYIEHTTPVRFRRYVREGIEMWNDAFEEIGIVGAIEVYQQDAQTGAHMDKDPEDSRYNFFRWNASNQGYAIGPSRTNPRTGEILDADVVWHQGLTRAVRSMLENLSDDLTEQAFDAETLAFFAEHPEWDPRVRLSSPSTQPVRAHRLALAAEEARSEAMESSEHPWLRFAEHMNRQCNIGGMLSMNISLADAAFAAGLIKPADDAELLDGLPEEFIGPMIRYISAHEVGHCLGLQHNMTASTIRTLEEMNTPGFDGPLVGSVMEYAAPNINHNLGEVQGPYATDELGPYDTWAIAFGYADEKELPKILARVNEPDLIWLPQPEISVGSDPRNQTWELGKDNLTFAESRLGLVKELRGKLVSDVVDDGESWAQVRRRYNQTLGTHVQSLFVAERWIGGTFSNTNLKGDPDGRPAIEDVPAAQQRRALNLIIANAFEDDAFGLTPDLVRHFGKEYYWDPQGMGEIMQDPSFTVHDQISGIQATALSLLMNPTKLRRVYDNEFRAESDDSFTLAELVDTVTGSIWREIAEPGKGSFTTRSPMVSSFRRNLQREHIDRLVTLVLLDRTNSPAMRTISTMAKQELRSIDGMIEKAMKAKPDAYTEAHLADARVRIARAMEASYVIGR